MKIDEAAFEEIKLAVETGADPAFWHSRTQEERMMALELMRERAYGYDEYSVPKLQRVIEFATLKHYGLSPAEAKKLSDLSEEQS